MVQVHSSESGINVEWMVSNRSKQIDINNGMRVSIDGKKLFQNMLHAFVSIIDWCIMYFEVIAILLPYAILPLAQKYYVRMI
jgi:hypothetical protein